MTENYVQVVQTFIKNYAKMGCRMSLKVHILDAILKNSRRTLELTQRSKVSGFIKIYWTLNIATNYSITKKWLWTTFGGLFEKAICSTLANLEKLLISEPSWVIFDCLCLLTMQVLFFISCINKNVKMSLFCYNKYDIFLGCVHKIKVCAECSRFSIGFRQAVEI